MTDNILKQVESLKQNNRWQDIISLLKPLVDKGQADTRCLSSMGFAYSQLKRYDEARYCYKQWLEKAHNPAPVLYCLGYLEYDQKRWTQAIEWFDMALEEYPDYIVCLYRKGVALYNKLQFKNSKETLDHLVRCYLELNDTDAIRRNAKYFYKAIFYLGKSYYQLGQKNNALACFQKLLEEDVRDYVEQLFKQFNWAKALFSAGRHEEALKVLKTLQPKDYVLDLEAQIYADLGENQRAEKLYGKALERRAASYIFSHRGLFYKSLGESAKAERDFHDALKRDRVGKHKILFQLALLAEERDDLAQAENFAERSTAFKRKLYERDYLPALEMLARIYDKTGRNDKARQTYETIAALTPDYFGGFTAEGMIIP